MRVAFAIGTLCVALLVGCTGDDAPNNEPLNVQIRLSKTTASAGRPIHGVAVVTNRNDRPLVIGTCNHVWLQVGLTGAEVSFHPVWDLCADKAGTAVQPGITRMPITIQTTYPACTPHARSATAQLPVCPHPNRNPTMPPLPPGHYFTRTIAISPAGASVITSPPMRVTITS